MTREEAYDYAMRACERTWNNKVCADIRKALEQEPLEVEATKLQKAYNKGFEDCRQAVMNCFKKWQPYMATRIWEFEKELSALPSVNPQPCEDAISRQATVEQLCKVAEFMNEKRDGLGSPYVMAALFIQDNKDEFPSVTPKQRTGHWINVNEGKWNTIPAYKCSVCGANADLRDWSGESPFCPWCGAKMVEPQETETWNGIHAQITAPKGTFERIFNDKDDDNDI